MANTSTPLRIASCTLILGATACSKAPTAPTAPAPRFGAPGAAPIPAAPNTDVTTQLHDPLHILEDMRELQTLDRGARRGGVAALK